MASLTAALSAYKIVSEFRGSQLFLQGIYETTRKHEQHDTGSFSVCVGTDTVRMTKYCETSTKRNDEVSGATVSGGLCPQK